MTNADAVVIGGGVIGLCSAIGLARLGLKRVLLCEQRQLGWGQSGRSLAVISQHYSDPSWVKLAVEGLHLFQGFEQQYGGSCGYVPSGLLVLANHDLADAVAMQRQQGAEVWCLNQAEQQALDPTLVSAPYASWQPQAGYVDCLKTIATLQAAAANIVLREETLITRIVASNSRVEAVVTSQGDRIETPIVIQATGAWTVALAASVGVALPLVACRQLLATLRRPEGVARYVINDFCQGFSARTTAESTDIGWFDRRQLNTTVGLSELDEAATLPGQDLAVLWQAWQRRYPRDRATLWGGWSGVYDVTPDWLPIVDQVGPEGYYLCCGTSGHGFKFAPVFAQILANWVSGVPARAPHLAWERFYP